MLKSPLLFSISVLVTLLSWTNIAKANDDSLELSFALPPAQQLSSHRTSSPAIAPPLPTPEIRDEIRDKTKKQSAQPPLDTKPTLAFNQISRPTETLRAITESWNAAERSANDIQTIETGVDKQPPIDTGNLQKRSTEDVGLQFSQNTLEIPTEKANQRTATINAGSELDVSFNTLTLNDWMFEGGSGSLVAHTVGSAEGTRYWNGQKTKAYYGHTDPGNGVWNLGTFSYQHEAKDPEDADEKQLKRLKRQGDQLQQQAEAKGIQLSLKEKLNGLDLANQAPLAALGEGGYIDRLEQAYRLQMSEMDAIAWARTRAYIDPNTKTWNAPGLGNNLYSISKDQERRMAAIDKALSAYEHARYPELELAKLDSFHIQGSGLTNSRLGRTVAERTTLGSVAEEFKLAAHDIAIEEISAQANILASAINFDLPAPEPSDAQISQANEVADEGFEAFTQPSNLTFNSASAPADTAEKGFETDAAAAVSEDVAIADLAGNEAIALSFSPAQPSVTANETDANETDIVTSVYGSTTETATPMDENGSALEDTAQQTQAEGDTNGEELQPTLSSLLNTLPKRETGEVKPNLEPAASSTPEPNALIGDIGGIGDIASSRLTDDNDASNRKQTAKPSLFRTEDRIVSPQ